MTSPTAPARAFAQVDVFTAVAGLGNPVAVVLDADGLSGEQMQRFAGWTNLSETTFVLPPTTAEADYRVRIFTPDYELPFAGHPTIGTAWAQLDAGLLKDQEYWVQECGAGLVEVTRTDPGVLSFVAPAPVITDSPRSSGELGEVLGVRPPVDPILIEVGPRWITARVDVADLDAMEPDANAAVAALAPEQCNGVTLYAVDGGRCVHVRSFFPSGGLLVEDPVCGSGNAAVALHLRHTGNTGDVPPVYQARQGRHRGRDGRITVSLGDRVRVGGPAVTVVTGTVSI